MIKRKLKNLIKSKLNKGKAIILIGARQVGKTTANQLKSKKLGKVLVIKIEEEKKYLQI